MIHGFPHHRADRTFISSAGINVKLYNISWTASCNMCWYAVCTLWTRHTHICALECAARHCWKTGCPAPSCSRLYFYFHVICASVVSLVQLALHLEAMFFFLELGWRLTSIPRIGCIIIELFLLPKGQEDRIRIAVQVWISRIKLHCAFLSWIAYTILDISVEA